MTHPLPDKDVVNDGAAAEDDPEPDDHGGDHGRRRVEVQEREQHHAYTKGFG